MDGLANLLFAAVFIAHVVAFSIVGWRRRRRGEPAARYVVLVTAFALLAAAQFGQLAIARGWSVVPEQSVHSVTWIARALFGLGLVMLVIGFVRRRARRHRHHSAS